MANDTRRISQLTQTTVLNSTDRVLVLSNPNTTPNVQTISFSSFVNSIAANLSSLYPITGGPVANTIAYGIVKIDGVTIFISNTGQLNNKLANSSVKGVVILGSTLGLDANSALTVNTTSVQLNSTLSANIAVYLPTYAGVVNAASHTTTGVTANATGVFLANTASLVVGNATVNTIISQGVINTTSIVNAASFTIGTSFTANSTLANTVAINVVNQTNTGTLHVTTSANVGTYFTVNSSSTSKTVNASFTGANLYITGTNTSISANVTISANLTVTGNITGNTNGVAIGYRDLPQNFTNTSFTLAANDASKHILTQNSGASTQTITVPNNASTAFITGAAISIVVQSTGTVALANGAGVTMYLSGNSTAKSSITLNSYSMTTLLKIGTDTWIVGGAGVT